MLEIEYVVLIILTVAVVAYKYGVKKGFNSEWGFGSMSHGVSFRSGKTHDETIKKIEEILVQNKELITSKHILHQELDNYEEMLFMITELFGNPDNLEILGKDELYKVLRDSRAFTRHFKDSSFDYGEICEKQNQIRKYLKEELWFKAYKNKFDEIN